MPSTSLQVPPLMHLAPTVEPERIARFSMAAGCSSTGWAAAKAVKKTRLAVEKVLRTTIVHLAFNGGIEWSSYGKFQIIFSNEMRSEERVVKTQTPMLFCDPICSPILLAPRSYQELLHCPNITKRYVFFFSKDPILRGQLS